MSDPLTDIEQAALDIGVYFLGAWTENLANGRRGDDWDQVTAREAASQWLSQFAGDDVPGVEVARITIVKTFNDDIDGAAGVHVRYSDLLSLIDALGMISFAEMTTIREYLGDDS